jgi:hypothetical protein
MNDWQLPDQEDLTYIIADLDYTVLVWSMIAHYYGALILAFR